MHEPHERALVSRDLLAVVESVGSDMAEMKMAIAQLGQAVHGLAQQQGLARMRTLWQDENGSFGMEWSAQQGSRTWTQVEEFDTATGRLVRRTQQDQIQIRSQ